MSSKKVFESYIGNSKRKQEIFTPANILQAVYGTWDKFPIDTDPCWHPDSLVAAEKVITHHDGENSWGTVEVGNGCDYTKWEGCTFINPPFKYLKDWLEQAGKRGKSETICLFPNRLHRTWQRRFLEECTVFCFLNYNVKFVGFDQAFPQSLIVSYQGEFVDTFTKEFNTLGDCYEPIKRKL